MSARLISPDLTVARRFDEAQARFKTRVDSSDFRLEAILTRLGEPRGQRILDLGCGKGRFARALIARGAEVVGLDVSRGMLSAAEGLQTVQGSVAHLPFAASSFDAILMIETLQHVNVVVTAVLESFRVLRPHGRLLIVDKNLIALNALRPWLPNALVKWVDERRGRGMYRPGDSAHERWFSPRGLATKLMSAGFNDVTSQGLISSDEAGQQIFEHWDFARAMRLWTGQKPGVVPC